MCSTVPQAARAFSPFRKPCMAVPTRIKPIWDMEEQASVRFRSTENSASTAPSTIVTTPRASTTVFQGSSVQNRYRQRMSTPKTPLLVRMPDSRADAGAGATGWAFGSQMFRGNIPALAPNPTNAHPPATYRDPRFSAGSADTASAIAENSSVPSSCWRSSRPASSAMPPITATARYVCPACRASSVSFCTTHT